MLSPYTALSIVFDLCHCFLLHENGGKNFGTAHREKLHNILTNKYIFICTHTYKNLFPNGNLAFSQSPGFYGVAFLHFSLEFFQLYLYLYTVEFLFFLFLNIKYIRIYLHAHFMDHKLVVA